MGMCNCSGEAGGENTHTMLVESRVDKKHNTTFIQQVLDMRSVTTAANSLEKYDYSKVPQGFEYNHEDLYKTRVEDAEGAIYIGKVNRKTKMKEGPGRYEHPAGVLYEGWWKNNMRHGHGRQLIVNEEIYEGYWENDCKHGKGRADYADGSYYTGAWKGG